MKEKIHYLKSEKDYPPEKEYKILFYVDPKMPLGYNVTTGFYTTDGMKSIGGNGFYARTKDFDFYISASHGVSNVFAWMDFPMDLDIPDMKSYYYRDRNYLSGFKFRKWRRSLEITQQEVADSVKCSKSAISRWESGEINLLPELYDKIINYYERKNEVYD